ncbi:MAG: YlmC/YmxH family sporulation protein [Clostridia bacterium]|nr:YlmC/YmxH family sporulation protein [Clostridia bacterium]MBQ4575485.1 YlmC/YmxH family sporulation protein [Clostridia bacterium]
MSCSLNDLRDKEVVNVCDGRRLGYVCDLEIDLDCGKICAIIVPGDNRFFGLGRGSDCRIPWENIERIGDDIIIVNIKSPSCDHCGEREDCPKEKKRKHFFGL